MLFATNGDLKFMFDLKPKIPLIVDLDIKKDTYITILTLHTFFEYDYLLFEFQVIITQHQISLMSMINISS